MIDKSMPITTHVVRRGATYYFRMRIPAGLVSHYGKKEIGFSLKTKDQAEAKRKGHVEALRFMDEFKSIRSSINTNTLETMSPKEIQDIADTYLHDLLSSDEVERKSGRVSKGHQVAIEVLEDHARPTLAGDWDHDSGESRRWMTKLTRNQLEGHNLNVPIGSDLENELIYAFAQASVAAIEAIKQRDRGKIVATPESPPAASLVVPAPPTTTNEVRLSQVIEQYSREQTNADNWQGKTGPENRAIYSVLLEIIGDVPVSELGFPHMLAFKDALQRLPANINKDRRYRGKSILEILALPDLSPIGISTANKYISRVANGLK